MNNIVHNYDPRDVKINILDQAAVGDDEIEKIPNEAATYIVIDR